MVMLVLMLAGPAVPVLACTSVPRKGGGLRLADFGSANFALSTTSSLWSVAAPQSGFLIPHYTPLGDPRVPQLRETP